MQPPSTPTEFLVYAVSILLVALLIAITKQVTTASGPLRAFLEQKLGKESYALLMEIARSAVLAVEQMTKDLDLTGAEKKARASDYIATKAKERGIEIDAPTLSWIIEANVAWMKLFKGPA